MDLKTRFVVVAGGVISGVGKGVTTASIGKLFKEYGYKTTLIKIDPYINYDAGTLRPTEHGEVWVTEDGGEIDQDLGTYERFLNEDIPKQNNITTGQIYKSVIDKERNGHYLGETVQFIPHILDEILLRIKKASAGYDVAVIEIGGTVGDYENLPFLCALKSLKREYGDARVACVLVTYLPVPEHIGEMKTKPTQQAVRMLSEQGILPDFIVCRSKQMIDEVRKKKIEICANVPLDNIITAPNIESVYQLPLLLESQQFGKKLLNHLQLAERTQPDWTIWNSRIEQIVGAKKSVSIAVVGKYLDSGDYSLTDSYLSICHALIHAGAELGFKVVVEWIDAKRFESGMQSLTELQQFDGVLVPGGFGADGVEGKIAVIKYAREHAIPFLGICYGMQLAVVEFARNVCGLSGAHTTEVNQQTPHPVVDILPLQKELLQTNRYGGTMRLGAYSAKIKPNTRVAELYKNHMINGLISERHRHRYEINPAYVPHIELAGGVFSAYHERHDGTRLMEFFELPSGHPFFVGMQGHPEFKSRLDSANPLFLGFVKASGMRHEDKVVDMLVTPGIRVGQGAEL